MSVSRIPRSRTTRSMAMTSAMQPNTVTRADPLKTAFATQVPIRHPKKIHRNQALNKSQSTAPALLWLTVDAIEVGIMVAREVPMAICMLTLESIPSTSKAVKSMGTITIPPPTPRSPAVNPAKTPVNSRTTPNANRDGSVSINLLDQTLVKGRPLWPVSDHVSFFKTGYLL